MEERLQELELKLLSPLVRKSRESLSSLLAPDFREFGSSGRVFSRSEITEALETEPPVQLSISDLPVKILADGVALVTYRALKREAATHSELASLRSSLWVINDGQWQMLFHQGTNIAES